MTSFDLDAYAAQAETFIGELDREYHLHYSGQKAELEVEPVYERHAALFDREPIERLRELADGGAGGAGRRAAQALEFAVGGHMGRACAPQEAAIAAREAQLSIELDGEPIPYRLASVVQANEPDRERRARIESATTGLLAAELNPLYLEALERSHELVVELGWPSYADAYAELRGIDLAALAAQTAEFLEATAGRIATVLEPELRKLLGIGLDEMRRSDIPRFVRAADLDTGFDAEWMVPAFAQTMAGLGIDLDSQANVILDTERRPTKTPRAYCAPVRVPDEVYLVVSPIGGREDFAALFHEGGHAEHYANTDPGLAVEHRYLGDNSVTESYAFLLEHLTSDPAWLEDVLGIDAGPVVAHERAVRLYFLRRYAAKIAYELELHGPRADLQAMPQRYSAQLGGATGVEWPAELWLSDVDGGFYVAGYLRAWALEAHWRTHLRDAFGPRWFADAAAGEWLRGLWRRGQELRADELLAEVSGEELDFAALAADFA